MEILEKREYFYCNKDKIRYDELFNTPNFLKEWATMAQIDDIFEYSILGILNSFKRIK